MKMDITAELNSTIDRMRTAPYWREKLRNCPKRLESPEDLGSFPLLEEDELRRCGREMVLVPPGDIGRIVTLRSSGTTGPPKKVYLSPVDLERTVRYFAWGLTTFCSSGDRLAVLYPGESRWSVRDMLITAAQEVGLVATTRGSMDLQELLEGLNEGRWDVLAGTPAQLAAVARGLKGRRPRVRLRSALSSGALLSHRTREAFSEATGAEIFDHWGCREGGYGGALECRFHRGMHVRPGILAEVLDRRGEPSSDGTPGALVITTYGAHGMPLLRYKTGDLALLDRSPCHCGNGYPRLSLLGRIEEIGTDPMDWASDLEGWGKRPSSSQGSGKRAPNAT